MSTIVEFKYRIIYESLSRFSSALSRSVTLEDIRLCLQRQLKYLFDYQVVRFCFYQQGHFIVYSIVLSGSALQCGDETLLWAHEQLIKTKDVPLVFDDERLIAGDLDKLSFQLTETPTQIWGWNIGVSAGSGLIVSVFSNPTRLFNHTDVPILKIAVENLYAKILSICLIDELSTSKKAVELALRGVQEKSEVIARLVATQEDVIQERTRQLEDRNAQLVLLSRQHAHTIREPLARILSLAYLIEIVSAEEAIEEIIPLLVTTSTDLDVALQEVIQRIDSDVISPN